MHISYINTHMHTYTHTHTHTRVCVCVYLKYNVSKYVPVGFIKDHTHSKYVLLLLRFKWYSYIN
jgi:hypothetical protein